jgi:hypothetical protein
MTKKIEEDSRQANCFIEEDLYQKIKREAKHQGVSHQKLLNQHLREYFLERSKNKKLKRAKDKLPPETCPHCGNNTLAKLVKKPKKGKGFLSRIFG